MPRVIFLTAPFKARMMERMVEHFSNRLECKIVVPPSGSNSFGVSVGRRLCVQFLGDSSFNKSIFDFAPDIIYSDTASNAAALELACMAAGRTTRFIIHLRGDWWREYSAWFMSAKWRTRFSSSSLVNYAYNWLALLNARRITPICRWLDRVVKAHLPTKPTEVVYQGVDPSEYSGRYDDIGLKRPAVVVIQNHAILPKVEGLLSFRRVIQKLPAVNFYIAEGEDFGQSYLPLIKESFSRCNNVHFVKGINNPTAVRNMLGSADAYVLASGLDCCPTTILEASLMRRAVIASRVGGIPEIVLQNETGWTIGNESINEWVSKLSMILEDAKLRKRIGERGREWVTEKFGWRTIGTQVEHLLTREAATRP